MLITVDLELLITQVFLSNEIINLPINIEFIIATINRDNILKRCRLESTFKLLDKV